MHRYLFLLHRYLGIVLGVIVSVWCLSGIVMMYVQYPEMSAVEEAAVLEPLDLSACCRMPVETIDPELPINELRIEMLAGKPVMRTVLARGQRQLFSLADGSGLARLDSNAADAVARSFADIAGIARYAADGPITRDQWTVYGAYDPHRPLYRFSGADAAGTQWYVSSATGEVVQVTTARERFWNWLGAVPHWLYPTVLRQHTFAWSQTVIWLTIIGIFLTVVGVYVGVHQFRARRNGRYSPYRGPALWHHYTGLVFGALMLTWLVSGFFSMNPWGALEGRSFTAERDRQQGTPLRVDAGLIDAIERLPSLIPNHEVVRIAAQRIVGRLILVAWDADGRRWRLGEDSEAAESFESDILHEAGLRMRPQAQVAESGRIDAHDAYYYSHHEERALPVHRIVYADGERIYLDPVTGEIVHAVDADRRWYRWLHYALHRGDFTAGARTRPVWDAFMLPLMLGVSVSALTGTWMGIRRVRRWTLRKGRPAAASASLLGSR